MRTPVALVAGQGDTDAVTSTLPRRPGTLVIEDGFDGHVVRRTTLMLQHGLLITAETALELAPGCISCTRIETASAHLDPDAGRGASDDPHDPLLGGEPPLHAEGGVKIVEFHARRPFHPQRLHRTINVLLDGVIRTRGRAWLANRPEQCAWIESADGGMRIDNAGKRLATMSPSQLAYVDPQRRALAELMREHDIGDRHTSMTVLACGAEPAEILKALGKGCLLKPKWPGRIRGADIPILSANDTRILVTISPGWPTKRRHAVARAMISDEARNPSRGLSGRYYRRSVSHPLNNHQLAHHRPGNPRGCTHLSLGGGRSDVGFPRFGPATVASSTPLAKSKSSTALRAAINLLDRLCAEKVTIFHAFRPRGRETPRQTEGGPRCRLPAVDHNNESSLKG